MFHGFKSNTPKASFEAFIKKTYHSNQLPMFVLNGTYLAVVNHLYKVNYLNEFGSVCEFSIGEVNADTQWSSIPATPNVILRQFADNMANGIPPEDIWYRRPTVIDLLSKLPAYQDFCATIERMRELFNNHGPYVRHNDGIWMMSSAASIHIFRSSNDPCTGTDFKSAWDIKSDELQPLPKRVQTELARAEHLVQAARQLAFDLRTLRRYNYKLPKGKDLRRTYLLLSKEDTTHQAVISIRTFDDWVERGLTGPMLTVNEDSLIHGPLPDWKYITTTIGDFLTSAQLHVKVAECVPGIVVRGKEILDEIENILNQK